MSLFIYFHFSFYYYYINSITFYKKKIHWEQKSECELKICSKLQLKKL